MTELYLLFYSHALQYYCRINRLLQRDEPIIAILHEQVLSRVHSTYYGQQSRITLGYVF
jgi:hypothetical protein